jgi:hypothetical protein
MKVFFAALHGSADGPHAKSLGAPSMSARRGYFGPPAGLFPLFLHVANQHQAETGAQTVRRKLLMPGGIVTTLVVSGQQWDHPNGWAPLQWIAVVGLRNYNEAQLADAFHLSKPLAPEMFSMKIDPSSSFASVLDRIRATVSVAPPGAKPTTTLIGRLGKSLVCAADGLAAASKKQRNRYASTPRLSLCVFV